MSLGRQTPRSPVAAGPRPDALGTTNPSRDSYYGRAVLKPPVWTWEVPLYFFAGGLAGASAPLALVAGVRGDDALARRAALTAAVAGGAVSPALLVADLGVPKRFLHMLRVLKVTSPMSVGAWVLTGFGPAAVGSAAWRAGLLPRAIGVPAEATAAVLGPVLATYTAALVATTSVPVWHEARRELPFVFAGSAAASAGAWGAIVTPRAQAAPARRLALAGVACELVASQAMHRRLGDAAQPYRRGTPATLLRAGTALSAAGGIGLAVAGGRRRGLALASAAAVLGGALAERWAVFRAGADSARDPAQTVELQRQRRAA